MITEVPGVSFLYTLAKDLFNGVYLRLKPMPPEEKLARREKWKPIFEDYLLERWNKKLANDVYIRDLARIDEYPEEKTKRGISACFRAGLMCTYHRGIVLGLRWTVLMKTEDGQFRFCDFKNEDYNNGTKVILCGRVPFELIESVDFDGDEYSGLPHIYCSFRFKGEPYEDIGFYQKGQIDDMMPYYTRLESLEDVKKRSHKLGFKQFI